MLKALMIFNLILLIIIILLRTSRSDGLVVFTYFPILNISFLLQLIIGIITSIKDKSINLLLISSILFIIALFFVLASLPPSFGRQ